MATPTQPCIALLNHTHLSQPHPPLSTTPTSLSHTHLSQPHPPLSATPTSLSHTHLYQVTHPLFMILQDDNNFVLGNLGVDDFRGGAYYSIATDRYLFQLSNAQSPSSYAGYAVTSGRVFASDSEGWVAI